MKRDEISLGAAARELMDRPGDPPDPLGKLSPAEAVLVPPTREWIERHEQWAYYALGLAATIRRRLERGGDALPAGEFHREQVRLADARERAAQHLDALRSAGALTDQLLIDAAKAEGIEP